MSDPVLRPAVVGDAADIHTLLLRLAADIPLAVESLEQEEALYAQLRKTLGWGESWVVEEGGQIVGCVLVDNVQTGRHWGENEALDMRYAAGESLDALIGKVLERAAPVSTGVKDANRTGLVGHLEQLGFRETETRVGERRFRHDP
ncbi:MAG TPA: hypothetical protein VK432_06550 [Stellaceae bacterium]|nr:hypothetical protein [Stellaceae bacterium]